MYHKLQSEDNAAMIKQLASVIFEPTNDPQADEAEFIGTIWRIVDKSHTAST